MTKTKEKREKLDDIEREKHRFVYRDHWIRSITLTHQIEEGRNNYTADGGMPIHHESFTRISLFFLRIYLHFPRAIAWRSYTTTTTITISTDMPIHLDVYIYISKCMSNVMHLIAVCTIEVINRIKRKQLFDRKIDKHKQSAKYFKSIMLFQY